MYSIKGFDVKATQSAIRVLNPNLVIPSTTLIVKWFNDYKFCPQDEKNETLEKYVHTVTENEYGTLDKPQANWVTLKEHSPY